jgi:transcriptional repressor NrdR
VHDRVVDSRVVDAGGAIRRRRECVGCGRRYTTFERVEEVHLVVVKRSGAREPFDRSKIADGIRRAAKNRPIADADIEAVGVAVEEQMRELGPEVGSEVVGRAVLDSAREVGLLQKTTSPKAGRDRPSA